VYITTGVARQAEQSTVGHRCFDVFEHRRTKTDARKEAELSRKPVPHAHSWVLQEEVRCTPWIEGLPPPHGVQSPMRQISLYDCR
jgi:hypothetical protein